MLPLTDTHVHLLAGRDDGPRSLEEALDLCRMLVADGVRIATAVAHQNALFPENTPEAITEATEQLTAALIRQQIPLTVVPTGEVMLGLETATLWRARKLQSIGGHGRHLLVEMPHTVFLDVRPLITAIADDPVRLVIAHAERYPELLHDTGLVEEFIAAGCLIQVTTTALAEPESAREERTLRDWARRGIIHLLGTDGHRIGEREPHYQAGYDRLVKWIGRAPAERIASVWGSAVLGGSAIEPPAPRARSRSWLAGWWS